jgi:hypothetical protein
MTWIKIVHYNIRILDILIRNFQHNCPDRFISVDHSSIKISQHQQQKLKQIAADIPISELLTLTLKKSYKNSKYLQKTYNIAILTPFRFKAQ